MGRPAFGRAPHWFHEDEIVSIGGALTVVPEADGFRETCVALEPCGWSDWGTPERVLDSLRGTRDFEILLERLQNQKASEVALGEHATGSSPA